jgi:hypothetical protein
MARMAIHVQRPKILDVNSRPLQSHVTGRWRRTSNGVDHEDGLDAVQ